MKNVLWNPSVANWSLGVLSVGMLLRVALIDYDCKILLSLLFIGIAIHALNWKTLWQMNGKDAVLSKIITAGILFILSLVSVMQIDINDALKDDMGILKELFKILLCIVFYIAGCYQQIKYAKEKHGIEISNKKFQLKFNLTDGGKQ